jgi:ATP/maltotriose-dependent transcriptional regulator MalT
VLSGIALIEVARGRLRAARRAAQHALRLAETIDHTLFQCEALHALAETYAALGDTAQSEAATRRSASLLQSLNLQISHIRPAR